MWSPVSAAVRRFPRPAPLKERPCILPDATKDPAAPAGPDGR